MRVIITLVLGMVAALTWAQKPVLAPPATAPHSLHSLTESMQPLPQPTTPRAADIARFTPTPLARPWFVAHPTIERWAALEHPLTGRPDWVQLWGTSLRQGPPEVQCEQWFAALQAPWGLRDPKAAFALLREQTDDLGHLHLTWQQVVDGVPVYGNEVKAHFRGGELYLLNGRVLPTPAVDTQPSVDATAALVLAKAAVEKHTHFKVLSQQELFLLGEAQTTQELVVFYPHDDFSHAHLAWNVTTVPHLAARWQVMIDAHTGQVLREHDHICHVLPPNGPEVTTATDLTGISRTVHSYEFNNQNFLIDASRSMFNAANSIFPNEAQGVIWTLNGNNTSPANDNFQATHNVSAGNFWNNPLLVSAHYNAGEAYRYFKDTHNRNSINGSGGNVVSLVNIVEDDGTAMDNAFWNGQAMFYGNGNEAFNAPLAKALDVAGHEISHGVIQNTANLEYMGESGALNESFADIFGAMIDRDDWKMGEEVVNPSVFPSGALRDMANPNNGGTNLNSPGWQPAHTNQQYTGNQDNGGVHINSGIPNRAFYLFATQVGKDKAERVFYRALDVYLTRSSRFLDLRAAVVQACLDLYSQADANAAITAFNTVGIGSGSTGGTPTDTQEDLTANPGESFVLYTDGSNNNLYIRTPEGESVANPLTTLDPLSKPTVTDDGSAVVFVAQDKTIRAITIDWATGQTNNVTLSSQPVWRNVAISRDGNRLAALTDDNDNQLLVFDLAATPVASRAFTLYNPTYTEGIATGNVRYADVLEWDHSGEYVMYDALNEIPNQNGSAISYWDIGFIEVWNNGSNNFADGGISKLFSSLPENTSVGNPTFAKNAPYVIAFDFIDNNDDTYYLLAANIETGETGELFENDRLSYPNYSVLDDEIIFDAGNTLGDDVIGVIGLNDDRITAATGAFVFLSNGSTGARWGTWFANGTRQLVRTLNPAADDMSVNVYPTTNDGTFTVAWEQPSASEVQLSLIDALGRMVHQQVWQGSAGPQQRQFNTPLPSGLYWLQLKTAGGVAVRAMVVN